MDQLIPTAADLKLGEIDLGHCFEVVRCFSEQDVLAFAAVSGDYSPLHVDSAYAAGTEFGRQVVHGVLVASLFSQLIGMRVPGRPALYLAQDLAFRHPVLVGETVRAIVKVVAKSEATRTLVLSTEIRNAEDRVLVTGTAKVKVREDGTRSVGAAPPAVPTRVAGQQVALVAGASRGIGAQVARTLARRGLAVAVNYLRSADRARSVVTEIERGGGAALAVQADVRDAESVAAMLGQVVRELGPPRVLVNAAAGDLMSRPVGDLRWADFLQHLDTQVKAVLHLCQAVYPHMKSAGGGAIVNIASQVTCGAPASGMADYVTAKHALLGLSRAMAAEWAEHGIRVNLVSPGLARTELTEHYPERVFKMEAARTPLKRIATVEDIAGAVAYLAGDDAAFLTGVNISVTGGQVML